MLASPQNAMSQQKSLKEQLIGTWTLVSWELRNADGTTSQYFGTNPTGIAFFDAGGHYILTAMRRDRPKYSIEHFGQITQVTAEESRATVQGTMTYFGTYTVSESDRRIAVHVEASSFPNWNGTDQDRFFEIIGDQLRLIVHPPQGGTAHVLWTRLN